MGTVALALAVALGLGTGEAQTSPVCHNNPGTGERIECKEPADSTADIDINLQSGVNIETSAEGADGILGEHRGAGDIRINVRGVPDAATITTSGHSADGIYGNSWGKGSVDITVRDVEINTTATEEDRFDGARGVAGQISTSNALAPYEGLYHVNINVTGSRITTMGKNGHGISGLHQGIANGPLSTGNLEITATNTAVTTTGLFASGLYAKSVNSVGDVIVNMTGGSIMAAGANAKGIEALHEGTGSSGNVRVTVKNNAEIRTTGSGLSEGVRAQNGTEGAGDVAIMLDNATITTQDHGVSGERYRGPGAIDIDVLGGSSITTQGASAHGIYAYHRSNGAIDIDVLGGSSITTQGARAHGIYANHESKGNITIDVEDATIATESTEIVSDLGALAFGIYGEHEGDGDLAIDVRGGSITTAGDYSYGIQGRHRDTGHVTIKTHDGNIITTAGENAHGIVAYHFGEMPTRSMAVTVDGGSVTASGTGAQGGRVGTLTSSGEPDRVAAIGLEDGYRKQTVTVNGSVMGDDAGVWLAGGGRVVIGPRGTIGARSGIAILATGDTPAAVQGDSPIKPKLRVDMNLGGRRVAQAIGDHWILNDGGETTIAVNRVVLHDGAMGNTDHTAPNGAWNVTMRAAGVTVDRTDPDWMNTELPTVPTDVVADRDFSVQDFTETAKPRPRRPPPPPPPMPRTVMVDEPVFGDADEEAGVHLPAGGRVVIGPAGSVGGESGIAILAEGDAPMLHVDLTLDGRRVMEVIGDDWIMNDGGETTIVVNEVTLHEGATGVVEDADAPNGAFNVTMRPEGVTVMDRSDPDPANWVITEPAAGVVADRDFSAEDFIETPTRPMFTEEYAPRAALYELLPDFLLRLTGPSPNRRCGSTPDSSVWTRVAGGQGAYESDRSTTGATYDLERFEAEGGLSASLGARAKGWVSVRHVQGTAGVASPTGGGEIDVRGLGSSVGGSWRGANDVYAVGCFSYLAYDVDFASTQQGVLKAGVDGQAYTLDLEAGRRFAVGEQWDLTPRVWMVGSRVSVDDFTDAVDARVSLANADRVLGGLGVLAETARPWGEGEFSLRGSLDFERMLRGATTTTQVSGEQLSAEATENSLLVGLQGVYRQGRFTVGAEIAARQELGSTDSEYTSFLNLGISF